MNANGVVQVSTVAAGDGDRDRKPDLAALINDERVAPSESSEGHAQSTERVSFMRIRASEIDDKICLRPRQNDGKHIGESLEVVVVACSVR